MTRRGGRAVEGTGLENRRRGNSTVGSNPTPSATFSYDTAGNQWMGCGFGTALDVGCGEGRFCRMLQAEGIRTVGVDPTAALIHHARQVDPAGEYRIESAESMVIEPGSLIEPGWMDLVVSYLSLISLWLFNKKM